MLSDIFFFPSWTGTSTSGWSAGCLVRTLELTWMVGRFWTRLLSTGVKVCEEHSGSYNMKSHL